MVACDISAGALALADNNRSRHGVSSRVHLVQSDLLSPFPQTPPRFDLVCANLPYIPSHTLESLEVSKHEPWDALHGGRDGLDKIRELLGTVPGQVAPGGILLLEIEASVGEAVKALASNAFPAAQVHVLTDLAGHDRLVVVETA
jgi:release factor glutamine methyltransferase